MGVPMVLRSTLVWAVVPILASLSPELSAVEPGSRAPRLSVERFVQQPPGRTAAPRALILEFWATWCGPCVAAIDHLNEVASGLQGDAVTIWITDESADVVRSFLAGHRLLGSVAIDPERSTFDDFGVTAVPTTVVVDPSGVVRLVDHPQALTASTLRAAVSGTTVERPAGSSGSFVPPALFEVSIRPSIDGRLLVQTSAGEAEYKGRTLQQLLSDASGLSCARIDLAPGLPEFLYDAHVVRGAREADCRALLREGLEAAFGVTIGVERRRAAVYVLRNLAFHGPTVDGPSQWSLGSNGIDGAGGFDSLAFFLEEALGRPVVDATLLTGTYAFGLHWSVGDTEGVRAALAEQGLALEEDRREIDLVVVRRSAK